MFGERREIQLGKWTGWWRCREINTFNQRTNLRVGKWWITVRLDSLSERWISLNYNCIKHAREDSWKLFGTLKSDLKRKTDFVTDSLSLVIFIHRNRWLWSVEGDSAGRNISMGSYDYMDRSLPGWVDKWRQACVGGYLEEWLTRQMDALFFVLSLHPGNEVPSQSSEVHPGSGGSTDAWKGPRGQSKSWIQGQSI